MLHKAIKGYEDYLITDTGRVYSLKAQKYLSPQFNYDGYATLKLCKNGIHKTFRIHRLVAETFIPNPENKETVDHINRVRTDNRVENLRWATRKEQSANRNEINLAVKKRMAKNGGDGARRKRGVPVIEVFNDEISMGYLSFRSVPKASKKIFLKNKKNGVSSITVKRGPNKGRQFIIYRGGFNE